MEKNIRSSKEILETAKTVNYAEISDQVVDLLNKLERGEKINFYKYSQISPKTQQFLIDIFNKKIDLNLQELKVIIFDILSTFSPNEQDIKIEKIKKNIKTIKLIKKKKNELIKRIFLEKVLLDMIDQERLGDLIDFFKEPKNQNIKKGLLDKVLKRLQENKNWFLLLYFFKNPLNQKGREELVNEVLENLKNEKKWLPLLEFFKNPLNQKGREELVNEVLENLKEQQKWYNLIDFFKNYENTKINKELVDITIEKILLEGKINYILSFFKDYRNQIEKRDLLENLLKDIDISEWWLPLLGFFKNPINQQGREELVEKVLQKAKEQEEWSYIIDFLKDKKNQEGRENLLEETLKKLLEEKEWYYLLEFFKNFENQKGRENFLNKVLEGAMVFKNLYNILEFFKNPINQQGREELVEKVLQKAKKTEEWSAILEFLRNPKNQKGRWSLLEETLIKLEEGWQDDLIYFFKDYKNQGWIPDELEERLNKSLNSIRDKNLRKYFLSKILTYIKQEKPLSLFFLSSDDELPLFCLGELIGIPWENIKSWKLTNKERETFLPIMMRLLEKNIKFNFILPFAPRKKDFKSSWKIKLIDYFTSLDFISNFSVIFNKNLINQHLDKIKKIQEDYKINKNTLNFEFDFLKKIIQEISYLKNYILTSFKENTKINSQIDIKKIYNFFKNHPQLVKPLFVLSFHYQKSYPTGLDLLSKITESLINDEFYSLKYNLDNNITKLQLLPLLKQSQLSAKEIIDLWRKPVFVFKKIYEKKITNEEDFNRDEIIKYLQQQIIGHNHFNNLFKIEPLNNLIEEDKQKIINFLTFYLKENSKDNIFNIQEIKELLINRYDLNIYKTNIILGIQTLLKDLRNPKKKIQDIYKMIENLEKRIYDHWSQLNTVEAIGIDILQYLKQKLNTIIHTQKIAKTISKWLIAYNTDNPLTLLEIGKYPVATCQNYESTGELNDRLLSYVIDSNIQAFIIRELELDQDLNEYFIENSQLKVHINEEKELVFLETLDNKTIKAEISKPISRRIVFLAEKDEMPVLILEPIYGKDDEITKNIFLELTQKFKSKFDFKIDQTESSKNCVLPPSHNPAGYYLDR